MYDYLQLTIYNLIRVQSKMIKQETFFEEEDRGLYRTSKESFYLTDQQRSNINKRLPVGFSLIKIPDLPKVSNFEGPINFVGGKRQIRIASQQLAKQFAIQTQVTGTVRKEGRGQEKGLRCGQLPQGRSKHGEKIKNILQRLRKHPKFAILSQHLQRLGFASALHQIEAQNRKNIHTIQSFQERLLYLINQALNVTYQPQKVGMINQMIDEINFLVEIAQKSQFANSLFAIQKSIDKVTRQISEIKETGSFYYRKRKRNQKNYEEKELLYLAELMKALPPTQMVGVLEILQEKPFNQINLDKVQFDLNVLKGKKVRQLQFYVKKKLSNYYKSVERKHQKREAKKKAQMGEEDANNLINVNNGINPTENYPKLKQTQQKRERLPNSLQNQPNILKTQQNPEPQRYQQQEQNFQDDYVKKEAEIAYIFQEEEIESQDDRRGGSELEPSLQSVDRVSRSQYSDDFLNDNFFAESSRSNQPPSVYDSQNIRQPAADNLQFEQPNLYIDKSNAQSSKMEDMDVVEQQYMFQSSDSSYITDEDDSQF